MATADQATAILDRLARELDRRRSDVEELEAAYRGEHKLYFAGEDFREFFQKRYEKFADNWTGIVADAPTERLEAIGIRLDGQNVSDKDLWDVWRRNDADAYSDLAFLDAIIAKRSYALVWDDGTGQDQARITWEHPSQAIVEYDPETRQRSAGAKVWADDTHEYATLYLPDQVWKFERPRVTPEGRTESGIYVRGVALGWRPREVASEPWPIANPLGVVPLVELPNRPRLVGEPMSDIAGTLAMQRAINLIWSELFVAVDNASWPQKVVLGEKTPKVPVLDQDGNKIGEREIDLKKFSMSKAVWLENPQAKVSEWSAANLEAYTKIIETAVGHIAAQTRTPAHYLLIGGTMANVSSDAMKALETGLVKRTEEKSEHFGRSIREVFRLVALVEGNTGKAESVRAGQVLWRDIENRSDAQRADALQKKAAIGYPMRYILELDGLPPSEIDRVMQMREEEADDPMMRRLMREVTSPSPLTAPESDEATSERP